MRAFKYRSGINTFDKNGKSLFFRDVDLLSKNKIYAPKVSQLNDPYESFVNDNLVLKILKDKGQEHYQGWLDLKERLKNLGIYSISSNNDNEILWSHYASGHEGFAIEYDLNFFVDSFTYSEIDKMCYFLDVRYSKLMPNTNGYFQFRRMLDMKIDHIIEFYLGNKSTNWSHEEESRFILEKSGLINYDYRSVRSIYFGCRMAESEKDHIMREMSGRNINYFNMVLGKNYKLEPYFIKDNYADAPKYETRKINYDPFLISKEILKDNYDLKPIAINAIETVCTQPLVEKIIGIRIERTPNIKGEILVRSNGIHPLKAFEFFLDNENKLLLKEDIQRANRIIEQEIKEMNIEDYK